MVASRHAATPVYCIDASNAITEEPEEITDPIICSLTIVVVLKKSLALPDLVIAIEYDFFERIATSNVQHSMLNLMFI